MTNPVEEENVDFKIESEVNHHVEVPREDLEEETTETKLENSLSVHDETHDNSQRLISDNLNKDENLKSSFTENPFGEHKDEIIKAPEASVINNEIISELADKIEISPREEIDQHMQEPVLESVAQPVFKKIKLNHKEKPAEINKTASISEAIPSSLKRTEETKVVTSTPEIFIPKNELESEIKNDDIVITEHGKILLPESSHITETPTEIKPKNKHEDMGLEFKNKLDEPLSPKSKTKKAKKNKNSLLNTYAGVFTAVSGGLFLTYYLYKRYKS